MDGTNTSSCTLSNASQPYATRTPMTSLGIRASTPCYVLFLIVFGGHHWLTTSDGTSKHVMNARSVKQPKFEPSRLLPHQQPSSARHTSTQCSCHATRSRLLVHRSSTFFPYRVARAALLTKTGCTLSAFLFDKVICHWGAVEEIVTDNRTAFVTPLDWLERCFGIWHIQFSLQFMGK